jgi:hypothetical protein
MIEFVVRTFLDIAVALIRDFTTVYFDEHRSPQIRDVRRLLLSFDRPHTSAKFDGIRPHPRLILHEGLFNRKLMIFGEFPTKSFQGALPEMPANHARTSCDMPEQKSIVKWTCDQENALDLPRFV